MTTRTKALIIVGSIAALVAAAAGVREAGVGAEGGPGPKAAFLQELSAEQRAAVRDIVVKYKKEMIPLRAEMETKRLEVEEMVRAEAGKDAIFAKLDEIAKLRGEMDKRRMAMRLEIRAQLTAAQKEMMDAAPPMMEHKGAGGPGHGPGPHGPDLGE